MEAASLDANTLIIILCAGISLIFLLLIAIALVIVRDDAAEIRNLQSLHPEEHQMRRVLSVRHRKGICRTRSVTYPCKETSTLLAMFLLKTNILSATLLIKIKGITKN